MSTALDPAWKWVLGFCLVDFANRVLFGAFGTMLYPSQPYLAANLGTSLESVTALWSFGGIGWFAGTVASALTFKQRLRTCRAKMWFFCLCSLAMAATCLSFPYVQSYAVLLVANVVRMFLAAAWETAGAGMLVYTVGPVRERPSTVLKCRFKEF